MHIYILLAIKDKVVRPRNQINSNEKTLVNFHYMSLHKRIQGMIFTNKHTESSTLGFLLVLPYTLPTNVSVLYP